MLDDVLTPDVLQRLMLESAAPYVEGVEIAFQKKKIKTGKEKTTLFRFQFIELFVRIADKKLYR